MRPINLIPKEQRPSRGLGGGHSGLAPYLLLGVFGLALIGMLTVVLTSNKVNAQKDKAAKLERETQSARAAADELRPYGEFAKLQQARLTTLQSLANTSFNWERVLRALSRAIPSNVWLTSFTGTVAPDVSLGSGDGGGGGGNYRGKAPGPAVELSGCTYSQHAVARMMVRMRNIDGVTEVVLTRSERPESQQQSGGSESGDSQGGDDCRTGYRITKFELLVVLSPTAFAAPPSAAAPGTASPVAKAESAASSGGSAGQASPGAGQ